MEIEKMDLVAVDVDNLEEAMRFFSDILGVTFVNLGPPNIQKATTEHTPSPTYETAKLKIAMDRRGFLELIESDPPVGKEGLRNIHFKVPDIEKAKAEMEQKGARLIADIRIGGLKEAIFSPEDCHGIRFCLVEYDTPTLVDATLQR